MTHINTTTLVDPTVVRRWNKAFQGGDIKQYPTLDLVRLERWFFEGKPGVLLDYGCGTGTNLIHLAGRGHTVHGVDASDASIELVELRVAERSDIRDRVHLTHILPTATRLPFEDGKFDTIVCLSVLSLLGSKARVERLLAEFRRVLKPGGKLIVDINDARADFARNGTLVEEDVYELPGPDGEDTIRCYCPASIDTFVKLFARWDVVDVGYSAFKYMHSEVIEHIVCAQRPIADVP